MQYVENFVRSAIAPETIVAAVAQNTSWNTKLFQSKFAQSVNILRLGIPIKPAT